MKRAQKQNGKGRRREGGRGEKEGRKGGRRGTSKRHLRVLVIIAMAFSKSHCLGSRRSRVVGDEKEKRGGSTRR